MSLSIESWTSTLHSLMVNLGIGGADSFKFAEVVATGSVKSLVGASFTSTDVGLSGGLGTGSGTGLVVPPTISSTLTLALAARDFGGGGTHLLALVTAIDTAMVTESLNASLSTSSNVGAGAGVVDLGSIAIPAEVWGNNIYTAGKDFKGNQWINFANAIGEGMALAYKLAAGAIIIAGGGGSSGAGSGQGKIS